MDRVSMSDDPRSREPRPPANRAAAARDALGRAHLGKPSLGRITAQSGAGAGRRAQVAIAVFVALGVGLAYSYGVAPTASTSAAVAVPKATPVRNATVVCPEVTGPADATVNAITPTTTSAPAVGDTATLTALGSKTPMATLKQQGTLSVNKGLSGSANLTQDSIPIIGQAGGAYAPGFTVTETLNNVNVSGLRGIASTPCTAPDTDFWFLGPDPTAGTKSVAKLNLFDSDQLAAQVNLSVYNDGGLINTVNAQNVGQGQLVPSGTQHNPIDLSSFSTEGTPIAVHVTATASRVSAALLDSEANAGRDFVLAQKLSAHLLLPGVPAPSAKPASAMKLQLILLAPHNDADVTLHWIGHSKITPTVTVPHLIPDRVTTVDFSNVPATGEAGALQIDSNTGTPILAELKVTGEGGSDTAYISPVQALAGESLVADNTAGSVVELTNNAAKDAQVQVTAEGAGAPSPQTVTVPAQTTKTVTLQAPKGAADFAVSVEPLDRATGVYAARVMTAAGGMITIQPMSTALETVQIPAVRSDLSGTVPQ